MITCKYKKYKEREINMLEFILARSQAEEPTSNPQASLEYFHYIKKGL